MRPIPIDRKRTSKSGTPTPQSSAECAVKQSEFKFPEPLAPVKRDVPDPTAGATKARWDSLETRSLSPEDASQQLRNVSLRELDSISEGRRIGPAPSVLEVKPNVVGVRQSLISLVIALSVIITRLHQFARAWLGT